MKEKRRQGMMMKFFSRWKKGNSYTLSQNNKPVIIGNKHSLFDDIVGFGDVKDLFKMAVQAERPVHLLLCGPPSSGKSLFMSSLTVFGKDLTVFGKVSKLSKSPFFSPFPKRREPWPGFGPGTFALPRQRSTRLSYQGADILRHK